MLVGLRLQIRPVVGDSTCVRSTVPVKPLTPVTAMVEVPVSPTVTVTLTELADIVKSAGGAMVKATSTEWDSEPLVPVTVTV